MYAGAAGLMGLAAESRQFLSSTALQWIVTVAGFLVFVVSAWLLHGRLRRLRREGMRLYAMISAVIAVIGIAMASLWFFGEHTGAVGFAGVVAFYFGLGQLIGTLRAWPGRPRWVGISILGACAASFVVGLVVLTLDAAPWSIVALVIAVVGFPVALTVLTDDALDQLGVPDPPRLRFNIAAGIAVLIAGMLGLALVGASARYLFLLVAVLAVIVIAITSATDSDIVAVLLAIALFWALAPSGATFPDEHEPARGDDVIVALGDSYISGEGAEQFFDGTNVREKNECRRAPSAYSMQVVERPDSAGVIPDKVLFLACSGAKAAEVHETWQYLDEPTGGDHDEVVVGGERIGGQLAQLYKQRKKLDLDVKVVLLSIGGNDALFGPIGKACVAPGDCSTFGGFWLDRLGSLSDKLAATYARVRLVVGPDVPVLVVPYPIPLDEDGCDWSLLTAPEHRFLNGYTAELNGVVRRAVASAGPNFYLLDEVATVLGTTEPGYRICDQAADKVGINFLAANPVVGVLGQRVSPTNWFHNSFHPNKRGHEIITSVVHAWLETNLKAGASPPQPSSSGSIRSIDEVMGIAHFKHCAELGAGLPTCRSSSDHWTIAQVSRLIWYSIVPVLLVIVGAWFVTLQVIALRRGRPADTATTDAAGTT